MDDMTEIEQIESEIQRLDDEAFARLREWFIEYSHARWDTQIAADSADGKLDFLAEEALAEHRCPEQGSVIAFAGASSESFMPSMTQAARSK
jgi:hypothetical protein